MAAPYGRIESAPFSLSLTDFLTHIAILGASGAGKTCLTLVICVALIMISRGLMTIDGHDAIPKLLAVIADLIVKGKLDKGIINRFIVVSFSYNDWIVRFNPVPRRNRFESTRIAIQMAQIMAASVNELQMGPATAELVRNCFILLSDQGLPLTAVERLMSDDLFLRHQSSRCSHEQCRHYFLNRHLRKSAAQRRVYTEAFQTRLSVFLSDPRIRAMFSSGESDLDLRQAMDEGKIVLIDLNKGQLSENARLLGAMFLLSLQHAALSRSDIPESERSAWPVLVDEHQSLASAVSLQPLLNETRKFGVGLVLASQSYASMEKGLIQSIQTNCAHHFCFRLSPDDAASATAGLMGEERELVKKQIVQLPVGTAMMSRHGKRHERVTIDNMNIPTKLTSEHFEIINQIRQNTGVPFDPDSDEHKTPYTTSSETSAQLEEEDSPERTGIDPFDSLEEGEYT